MGYGAHLARDCVVAFVARRHPRFYQDEREDGVRAPRLTFRPPAYLRSLVQMEAATPLRSARVRTLGDRVVADGLVVDDECTVRLVREREEAGADAAALLVDAIEIGARVLDREQAGANADFVRGELEKVTRETEAALGERTREVSEMLARKV